MILMILGHDFGIRLWVRERSELMMTMRSDAGVFVGTYVCPECKKFFKTLEELRAHEAAAHGIVH